jgi:hypothetical protein
MELWILGGSFLLLLLVGVPVAFAIGLSSVAAMLAADLPVALVFQKMVGGMQVFSFLAIPFFIFAGELMLHGGIAERIVVLANRLVGHVRGGLGMSNVLGCTLFGGVAGSPLADVSAMGSVMIPMMKREGYDADYAVNVTTHASLVGALMPTSHNLIIYVLATSGLASVSVFGLILAGADPGADPDPRATWRPPTGWRYGAATPRTARSPAGLRWARPCWPPCRVCWWSSSSWPASSAACSPPPSRPPSRSAGRCSSRCWSTAR